MKELNDIKNEVCQEKYDCTFLQACTFMNIMDMESIMNDVAKRYAKVAVEDFRERSKVTTEDFYKGDLNKRRIKAYRYIAKDYNVSESTIRDIFSIGIAFAVTNLKNVEIILP